MRKLLCAAVIALPLVAVVQATDLRVTTITRPACNARTTFARAPGLAPADTGYYAPYYEVGKLADGTFATCGTVYLGDNVTAILPPLTGGTEPLTFTLVNMSTTERIVSAHRPNDVINGLIYRYSDFSEPWWPLGTAEIAYGIGYVRLQPGQAMTFSAMPSVLPNNWSAIAGASR